MLARGYYGHATPEHTMVLGRTREAGYVAESVGENIAKGQRSVDEVMKGWMASPEHRKNILNPMFTEAGLRRRAGPDAAGRRGPVGAGVRAAAHGGALGAAERRPNELSS